MTFAWSSQLGSLVKAYPNFLLCFSSLLGENEIIEIWCHHPPYISPLLGQKKKRYPTCVHRIMGGGQGTYGQFPQIINFVLHDGFPYWTMFSEYKLFYRDCFPNLPRDAFYSGSREKLVYLPCIVGEDSQYQLVLCT